MADAAAAAARRYRYLSPTNDSLNHRQSLPFLPDEIINDILSFLPVRSLLQFKRVCKSWKTLISNPKFVNNHRRNLTLNPSLTHQRLFCSRFYQAPTIVSYPINPLFENPSKTTEPIEFKMEHKFCILGSCNGLLCLFDNDEGYVKLWNPCIRFNSIKSPTLDCYYKDSVMFYYGFGYDHVNDKYKILVVVNSDDNYSTERVTKIYTFGGNSWATIQNFPCRVSSTVDGKFVSGTLNWGAFKRGLDSTSNESVILSFDIEKETYKELLLPDDDGVKFNDWNHVLGVLSDCLCVCFGPIKTHWSLWVMKKYGVAESWTRLSVIPDEQIRYRVPHRLLYIKPVFILENGIVLLSLHNKFVLFNLNDGRFDECSLLGSQHIGSDFNYYASLVSPQL